MTDINIQLISCEKCEEEFNQEHKIPLILPCGHTICRKCIESIMSKLGYVRCPIDAKRHYNDIKHFPKNLNLISLIEKHSKDWIDRSNIIFII